MNPNKILF
jgi:hypothetical protein